MSKGILMHLDSIFTVTRLPDGHHMLENFMEFASRMVACKICRLECLLLKLLL
jgi:hypothetical protein